jgi:hypothetical protein
MVITLFLLLRTYFGQNSSEHKTILSNQTLLQNSEYSWSKILGIAYVILLTKGRLFIFFNFQFFSSTNREDCVCILGLL